MGFFNKIAKKTGGFFNKVGNVGGNILNKAENISNKGIKGLRKVSNVADDILKGAGKGLQISGKFSNILGQTGMPVLSNIASIENPYLNKGGKLLEQVGKKLNQFNDKRKQLEDLKNKGFGKINDIKNQVQSTVYDAQNGEGSKNRSDIYNNELPQIQFD